MYLACMNAQRTGLLDLAVVVVLMTQVALASSYLGWADTLLTRAQAAITLPGVGSR